MYLALQSSGLVVLLQRLSFKPCDSPNSSVLAARKKPSNAPTKNVGKKSPCFTQSLAVHS